MLPSEHSCLSLVNEIETAHSALSSGIQDAIRLLMVTNTKSAAAGFNPIPENSVEADYRDRSITGN
jgi:hypothetical protein